MGRGCLKPVSSRSSPGVSGRPRLLSRSPVQSPLSIRRLYSKQDAAGGSAAAASRECHAPDRMSAELGLGLSDASDTRSGSSRIPGPAGRPGTNTGRAWGGASDPLKQGLWRPGPARVCHEALRVTQDAAGARAGGDLRTAEIASPPRSPPWARVFTQPPHTAHLRPAVGRHGARVLSDRPCLVPPSADVCSRGQGPPFTSHSECHLALS